MIYHNVASSEIHYGIMESVGQLLKRSLPQTAVYINCSRFRISEVFQQERRFCPLLLHSRCCFGKEKRFCNLSAKLCLSGIAFI